MSAESNIASLMQSDGFSHYHAPLGANAEIFSPKEVVEFKQTWGNLPLDGYLGKEESYRNRRILKMYSLRGGKELVHIDDCSFYQPVNVNIRLGGVDRVYERSEDTFIYSRLLAAIIETNVRVINETVGIKNWLVTCHQFRIHSYAGISGLATPEGIHCDGHDFVAQHLIARTGVDGGSSRIYDNLKNCIYTAQLEKFLETLMLDDRRLQHDVSPITKRLGYFGTSYRDMLIVDFDEIDRVPQRSAPFNSLQLPRQPIKKPASLIIENFLAAGLTRHSKTISLTANENVLSNLARSIIARRDYDRYFFNCAPHPEHRYAAEHNGMQIETFPEVLALAAESCAAAKRYFSAAFVEFRLLSGVHCTMSMVAALTPPNGVVLSISPSSGGHFATSHIAISLGRRHHMFSLTNNCDVSLDDIERAIQMYKNDLAIVIFDHGMTTHHIPVTPVRALLNRYGLSGTLILYDASHVLGLIAGGGFPNPLDEGADILQGNTHKSFPGPHRALAFCRNSVLAERISERMHAGLISSSQLPGLLQLFIAMLEVDVHGVAYAAKMKSNATLLAKSLQHLPDLTLQPTTTHIVLLEGNATVDMAIRLNEIGIRVNTKTMGSRKYLRLGTQEITRLGIDAEGIQLLGQVMRDVLLKQREDLIDANLSALTAQLQRVKYSFDIE